MVIDGPVRGRVRDERQEVAFAGPGIGAWHVPAKAGRSTRRGVSRQREQPHVAVAARRHDVAFAPLSDGDDAAGGVAVEVNVRRVTGDQRQGHRRLRLRGSARRVTVCGCTAIWSHQVTQIRSGDQRAAASHPSDTASSMPVGSAWTTTAEGRSCAVEHVLDGLARRRMRDDDERR